MKNHTRSIAPWPPLRFLADSICNVKTPGVFYPRRGCGDYAFLESLIRRRRFRNQFCPHRVTVIVAPANVRRAGFAD
jgi:hypothetical protein